MRALTLTQPWASAVALGSKRVETRSWKTSHRGFIAIHAAKGYSVGDLIHKGSCWNWIGALWETGVRFGNGPNFDDVLPFGVIVAVAMLADCRSTGSFSGDELDTVRVPSKEYPGNLYPWTERQMGDFSLGRFGFVLTDITKLETPIPCRGMLGLWTIPADIVSAIDAQLAAVSK